MRVATITAALALSLGALYVTRAPNAVSLHVRPPAAYTAPEGRVVSGSAELRAALRGGGTIVLADGSYDAPHALRVPAGTTLVAAHLGGAVLHTGLSISGPHVHLRGLAFSITDPTLAADDAAIDVWGGPDTTVEDVSVDGHRKLPDALDVSTPAGFAGRRIVARNLTGDGIAVDTYPRRIRPAPAPVLEDVDVAHVSHKVPRSGNGTSEACLWLGTQVQLTRAKLRDCAWMGLWTGFATVDARYTGVDVDQTRVGIYVEHFTTHSIFSGLHIGQHVWTGVDCEWADPAYGRRPASVDNVIRDSVFESSNVGVYLDEGTRTTSVVNSTFSGQSTAAIVDFRGRGNRYTGNRYAAGVQHVTHDHP